MKKVSYVADEVTGAVYDYREEAAYDKLWSKRIGGGMIKYRNYHNKNYGDKRLSNLITNKNDLLMAYILSEHIVKNTNRIGRFDGKGFADVGDIQDILGICEKRTRLFLGRMIKVGLLAKLTAETKRIRIESYAFNPVYINSCKYVPVELYAVFRKDIDAVIPLWMKDRYADAMKNQSGKKVIDIGRIDA